MTSTQVPQVRFLRVTNNVEKQESICRVIHEHFTNNQRVLVAAPTAEAAKFLDLLLWKTPKESFTPHIISNTPTQERVVITTTTANLNQANVLVNLSGTTPKILNTVEIVYELLDLTSPEKEAASLARQAAYTALDSSVRKEKL